MHPLAQNSSVSDAITNLAEATQILGVNNTVVIMTLLLALFVVALFVIGLWKFGSPIAQALNNLISTQKQTAEALQKSTAEIASSTEARMKAITVVDGHTTALTGVKTELARLSEAVVPFAAALPDLKAAAQQINDTGLALLEIANSLKRQLPDTDMGIHEDKQHG